MPGKMIDIKAPDGASFQGFLATPDAGSGAGVIVLQEIFGINYFMRETCHRLAAQGYMALCPDLFWRQQPGIELSDMTEAEWGRAFALYQGFDMDQGVGIQDALGEAENIAAPHMLHIAELDGFCPPEAQSAISEGLAGNANVTIHSYAHVDHAFARTGGEHFDTAAAAEANSRTAEFFAQNLA